MNKEEAARVLEAEIECRKFAWANIYNAEMQERTKPVIDALELALTTLSGWVRTADRLPEIGQLFLPIVKDGDEWAHGSIRKAKEDVADKALDYWIPIPPLPETAGVEGTKINGGE